MWWQNTLLIKRPLLALLFLAIQHLNVCWQEVCQGMDWEEVNG